MAASVAVLVVAACGAASAPRLTRGPYLQILTASSVTVVWNTDEPAACAVRVRSPAGDARVVTGPIAAVCAVALGDLAPGTTYGYVPLAGETALDGESTFHTDDPARAFTFLVVGDSGSGSQEQLALRDRMLASPPDFVLSTGDMVYESGAAEDFDRDFFVPYRDLVRRVVFWPVLGNHDFKTERGQPWRDAFWTPADNPAHDEGYYSFDYGNAHVVVLDSNAPTAPGSPQYAFLDAQLGRTKARWKLVAFHHAIYSSGSKHGSALKIRANLVPLFDRHHVDLVFNGHNHIYERTKPLRADAVVAPGDGTTYVTTGGGGKTLQGLGPLHDFTAYAEVAYHFTRVAIDGDRLALEMVRVDGTVGDTFRVAKDAAPH